MNDSSNPLDFAHSDRVLARFVCDHSPADFIVRDFRATERLNAPYEIEVTLTSGAPAEESWRLLGRTAHILLERGVVARTFTGIVARVEVLSADEADLHRCRLQLRPALFALGLEETTRIFQDMSALEILSEVLAEGLGRHQREVDTAALDPERYHAREYCVQYRETTLAFVSRLLEEEGIGYYFEHADPEKLVLFDRTSSLPAVATSDAGPVPFARTNQIGIEQDREAILSFDAGAQLTPTAVTVRDHDWTRNRPEVEDSAETEPRDGEGTASVYEHGFGRGVSISEDQELLATMLSLVQSAALPAVLPIGYDAIVRNLPGFMADAFTSNDVTHQARIRQELLRRDATNAAGRSRVTGFEPGRQFEMLGHPDAAADGRYFLTMVRHELNTATADGSGRDAYSNQFECLPLTTPWRPDRRTPKPRVYGIQTATVTGPAGLDVHTDQHGRVQIRFHWDRTEFRPAGNYTTWLRVSQVWAGQGSPGFLFIPRVGMEVVVSFVDGDPDRPLVTGCVYNGSNPTPSLLPHQATKSVIRTRTVPHGPGFNELSFEDAMGRELVHLRAERDLQELVQHDHRRVVHRHATDDIRGDETRRVGKSQDLVVIEGRRQTIGQDDRLVVGGSLHHQVEGSSHVQIADGYRVGVEDGGMSTEVMDGDYVVLSKGRVLLAQYEDNALSMVSDGADKGIYLEASGSWIHLAEDKIELRVGGSALTITADSIQVNSKTHPAPPEGDPSP